MIGSLQSFAAESPFLFAVFVLCCLGWVGCVVVLVLGALEMRRDAD
jgi:hypothetical protein